MWRKKQPPSEETNTRFWQNMPREAMRAPGSWSPKDTFTHGYGLWMRLVHLWYCEPVFSQSGYPLLVMVGLGQDRDGNYLVSCMMRGKRRSAQFRYLPLHPLMWSCPVEVGHIPIEYAARAASREGSTGGKRTLVAHSWGSVRRSHWLVRPQPVRLRFSTHPITPHGRNRVQICSRYHR